MGHRAVSIRQRGLFANLAQSRDRSLRRNSRFAALPLLLGGRASGVRTHAEHGYENKVGFLLPRDRVPAGLCLHLLLLRTGTGT
jgi:hypothetical protein